MGIIVDSSGEWCREAAVLASENGEPQATSGPGGADIHAVMAELAEELNLMRRNDGIIAPWPTM